MLTLSYGYLKPQNGDKGSSWFPALAGDIQQINDHTHDGIGSAKLTAASIIGVSDTILHANWVLVANGTYSQTITTPPSITFDSYARNFVIANGAAIGAQIYPSVVKVSSTTYTIYINDNTVDLTVLYLV